MVLKTGCITELQMNRRIFQTLLIILLWFGPLLASSQQLPFHIGARYGLSLPLGQFASHEFKRDKVEYGAYALIGSNFTAEAGWQFSKSFSILGSASVAFFPIASGYYVKDKKADDPALEELWIKSGVYEVSKYMLGTSYSIPLNDRFILGLHGMGGVCRAKSPDQLYAATYFFIGKLSWVKTPAISTSPAFMGGINLKYKLFDHVEIFLQSEYSYSKAVFTYWDASYTITTDRVLKMPMITIQPGLNITF